MRASSSLLTAVMLAAALGCPPPKPAPVDAGGDTAAACLDSPNELAAQPKGELHVSCSPGFTR